MMQRVTALHPHAAETMSVAFAQVIQGAYPGTADGSRRAAPGYFPARKSSVISPSTGSPLGPTPGFQTQPLLIHPSRSFVEVEGGEVRVRMAWGFRARFPRSSVTSASESRKEPLSRGVHGFAGRWLVNGSGRGIVSIELEPRQRGYVMGFPVRLRQLLVSVEDPIALMKALTS